MWVKRVKLCTSTRSNGVYVAWSGAQGPSAVWEVEAWQRMQHRFYAVADKHARL